MLRYLSLLLLVSFLFSSTADAQRNVSYQDLMQRSEQANIYLSYVTLPGTGEEPLFMVGFRMDYDLLPFRRVRPDQSKPYEEAEFYSTARMNMEVFRGTIERRRGDFTPVTRSSWTDTSWADSFEQTGSRFDHLEGGISINVAPGDYSLFLDLNRGESERSARSRERRVTIPDFDSHEKGQIVLLESMSDTDNGTQLKLLN
jgi:hypothetical protein